MQNLAQLKKRLAETLANGGTIDFTMQDVTTYGVEHPGFKVYPAGLIKIDEQLGCKIGRVQSNCFTRLRLDGKESWIDFGKASDWEFPDENTAVNKSGSYDGRDHKVCQTLTYKFNQ